MQKPDFVYLKERQKAVKAMTGCQHDLDAGLLMQGCGKVIYDMIFVVLKLTNKTASDSSSFK